MARCFPACWTYRVESLNTRKQFFISNEGISYTMQHYLLLPTSPRCRVVLRTTNINERDFSSFHALKSVSWIFCRINLITFYCFDIIQSLCKCTNKMQLKSFLLSFVTLLQILFRRDLKFYVEKTRNER